MKSHLAAPSTATVPFALSRDDDDVTHYMRCSNPDLAICGKDISELPFTDEFAVDCLFCIAAENTTVDICTCPEDCYDCLTCGCGTWEED